MIFLECECWFLGVRASSSFTLTSNTLLKTYYKQSNTSYVRAEVDATAPGSPIPKIVSQVKIFTPLNINILSHFGLSPFLSISSDLYLISEMY